MSHWLTLDKCRTVPYSVVMRDSSLPTDRGQNMTKWTRDRFALDDLGEWDGIHEPETTWNGFACPMFTLDTVREIADVVNDLPGTDETVEFGPDGRVFMVWTGNGIPERSVVPAWNVDGVDYFPVGAYGWAWDALVLNDKCSRCGQTDCDVCDVCDEPKCSCECETDAD